LGENGKLIDNSVSLNKRSYERVVFDLQMCCFDFDVGNKKYRISNFISKCSCDTVI